jgi:hypothetical protein
MKRMALMLIVLVGVLLAPTTGFAQVSCSRDGLQRAVDLYIAAQTMGDTSGMPLATGLGYMENIAPADINKGVIKTAMKIDHHRSLLDPSTCQTFTEVIVTNKEKPYVLGTRLRVNRDKIAEVEILWTTTGYWLFNADAYLKWSSSETWDAIPANRRDTRDILVAAANAYLDAFLEGKKDLVPWGYPCNRTEGGAHTGNGSPTDSCDVGVPSGVNIANRRFIVDETTGSVVVFCTFGAGGPNGGSGAPDTHLFRVENGKLRYVHTLTHLLQANFRGGGAGRGGAGGRGAAGGGQGDGAAPTTPRSVFFGGLSPLLYDSEGLSRYGEGARPRPAGVRSNVVRHLPVAGTAGSGLNNQPRAVAGGRPRACARRRRDAHGRRALVRTRLLLRLRQGVHAGLLGDGERVTGNGQAASARPAGVAADRERHRAVSGPARSRRHGDPRRTARCTPEATGLCRDGDRAGTAGDGDALTGR